MDRYFVTRWASILLGTGAFFVALGFIVGTNEPMFSPGIVSGPPISPTLFQQGYNDLTFSLLFYGGLQMAIGISILLFQQFRRQKPRDQVLLDSLLDQGV